MARTIQNLYVTGGQTFRITINGLNPVTEVKLFFDGVLVPSSQVKQVLVNEPGSDTFVGPIFNVSGYADKLITNLNGAITFDFTYTDSIDKQNYTTEEAYYRYAQLNGGPKSLIVIDAVTAATVTGSLSDTVDSDNLTQTLRKARCYSTGVIQLSYGIQFIEIRPSSVTNVFYDTSGLQDGPNPEGGTTFGFDGFISGDPYGSGVNATNGVSINGGINATNDVSINAGGAINTASINDTGGGFVDGGPDYGGMAIAGIN